jgi:integrase
MTPDEARARAAKLSVAIRDGGDPAAERKAEMKADDMNSLLDRYLLEHVEVRNRPTTQARVRDMVNRLVRPSLGKHKAKSVSTADVVRFHRSLAATPRTANLCLAALSKAFNLAETWGVRPRHSNPCEGVERFREVSRERFFSEAELRAVGMVMAEIEDGRQPWQIRMPLAARVRQVAVLRLLALTGMRLSEVLTLEWGMIDLEQGLIFLAEETTKAGRRVQPVGKDAVVLIQAQPVIKGVPWVFPREDGAGHISPGAIESLWGKIRDRAGLADARIHDLRHTVGTFASRNRANSFMIRDLLGHKTLAMTNRYVGKDLDPVAQLSDEVGSRIAQAMASRLETDKPE